MTFISFRCTPDFLRYSDVYRHESDRCRTLPFFLTFFISFILKSFPKLWVKYYRQISSHLYSPTSYFLVFLPNFLLSFLSFVIWSIHVFLGLPLGPFPSIFVCSIFIRIFSSVICITFPNHLNLLFSMSFFFISSTTSFDLI